jgi:hypothetical protein
METEQLTAQRVQELAACCLVSMTVPGDSEDEAIWTEVEGFTTNFVFHAGRLAERAGEIGELLGELNDNFHAGKGDGWTFLNACVDRNGRHWGEYADVEQLVCLGIATGQAKWRFPREMWYGLPGGLPYFVVSPGGQPKAKSLTDEFDDYLAVEEGGLP